MLLDVIVVVLVDIVVNLKWYWGIVFGLIIVDFEIL